MNSFYDHIAKEYDKLVDNDVKENLFPYSGYKTIQDIVTDYLLEKDKKVNILDLGCGTAKLYDKIDPNKFSLYGVDRSRAMIEIAKKKQSKAVFIYHDILKGLPENIKNKKFDYIIINYLFMHFDFKTTIDLINLLVNNLAKFGKIIIGDLLFINETAKINFFYKQQDYHELGLNFHIYSHFVNKIGNNLGLSFFDVNEYTGIIIIENINEFTLHFEEPLVKYKTNTGKWRSTHPQKKSE